MSGVLLDGIRHGRAATYKRLGCRCEPCKAAQRQEYAAWYAHRSTRKPGVRKTQPRVGPLKRPTDVWPSRP